MAKTIYSQCDHTALILREGPNRQFYSISGEIGLIDGLSRDDIVQGFPISLEATFNGKTIVINLTCIDVGELSEPDEGTIIATFYDGVNTYAQWDIPVSGQAFVSSVAIDKDLAESVFGQPSSKEEDTGVDEPVEVPTWWYQPVKIVTSSPEEDHDSNSNNNMKVLKITDDFKMSKILRMTDGYYVVAQNPILLRQSGSENVEQIPVDTIICIRSEDSPFYPMKTITNCNNDVTYYITSIFQNKDVIEYSKKDNAADPISIEQLDDRFVKKVILCHIEPPFESENIEELEAAKALKSFIETELQTTWNNNPLYYQGYESTFSLAVKAMWKLQEEFDNPSNPLPFAEKVAYVALLNTLPHYGAIVELVDGTRFDLPPSHDREPRGYQVLQLLRDAVSESEFDILTSVMTPVDEHGHSYGFNSYANGHIDEEGIARLDGMTFGGYAGRIKSVDIYVIQ